MRFDANIFISLEREISKDFFGTKSTVQFGLIASQIIKIEQIRFFSKNSTKFYILARTTKTKSVRVYFLYIILFRIKCSKTFI